MNTCVYFPNGLAKQQIEILQGQSQILDLLKTKVGSAEASASASARLAWSRRLVVRRRRAVDG